MVAKPPPARIRQFQVLSSGTKAYVPSEQEIPKQLIARDKLSQRFLEELAKDFNKHGAKAIRAVREKAPAKYIELISSLLPKENNVTISRHQSNHLDVSVSSSAEFLREVIGNGAKGSFKESMQNGPVLLTEVRSEEAGRGASVAVSEVPGSSGEPERPFGPLESGPLQEFYHNGGVDDPGLVERPGTDSLYSESYTTDSEGVSSSDQEGVGE